RGDTQLYQMIDSTGIGQTAECPTQLRWDLLMPCGYTLDVRLIDYRLIPGNVRSFVITPGHCWVDHNALWHDECRGPTIEREVGSLMAYAIAKGCIVPSQLAA